MTLHFHTCAKKSKLEEQQGQKVVQVKSDKVDLCLNSVKLTGTKPLFMNHWYLDMIKRVIHRIFRQPWL